MDSRCNSSKLWGDFGKNCKDGIIETDVKESRNGFLYLSASDKTDKDMMQNCPVLECYAFRCILLPDKLSTLSLESCSKDCRTTEERDHESLVTISKSVSRISFVKDACKDCPPNDISQKGEEKAVFDSSDPNGNNLLVELNSSVNSQVQNISSKDKVLGSDQVPEAQKMNEHEYGISGSFSFITRVQCHEEESSFTSASAFTYSWPVAYSRSLSAQSDSSTTSAKSFTFPTLQSEWNSSPVRMAKAEKNNFWKHGRWRTCLLCCRI